MDAVSRIISRSDVALAGFTLSIVAFLTLWTGMFGMIIWVLGLVLSVIGMKSEQTKRGKHGLVISILTLVFYICFFLFIGWGIEGQF